MTCTNMNSAEQLQVYDSQLAGNNSSRDPTPACPYPQYVLALVRICRGALALVPKVWQVKIGSWYFWLIVSSWWQMPQSTSQICPFNCFKKSRLNLFYKTIWFKVSNSAHTDPILNALQLVKHAWIYSLEWEEAWPSLVRRRRWQAMKYDTERQTLAG